MKKICLFFLAVAANYVSFGQQSAIIGGVFPNFKRDAIKCVFVVNDVIGKSREIIIPVQNGVFKQSLAIHSPTYLYLTDGENYFNGLIETGDSVVVHFDTLHTDKPLWFDGKGSKKFDFLFNFIQAKIYKKVAAQVPVAKSKKHPFDHLFNYLDSTEKNFVDQLNLLKYDMSGESYRQLLGDITGSFLSNRNRSVGMLYHENIEETLATRENELTPRSKQTLQNLLNFDAAFSYSKTYAREVYNILSANYDYRLVKNSIANDLKTKYRI